MSGIPERFGKVIGALPEPGRLPPGDTRPFETTRPVREGFVERDGVRHHHLIDPKTGVSPRELRSVTILAADGLTTEGVSKSVFVSGLDKGMRLVESLPGVDAVIVDADGHLHYSSGLLHGSAQPAVGAARQ